METCSCENLLTPVKMFADAFSGTIDVTTSHTPGTVAQSKAPDAPVARLPQLTDVPLVIK